MIGNRSESILSNLLKEGTKRPGIVVMTIKDTAKEKVVRMFVSSIIHPPTRGARGMKISEPIASNELTLPLRR